MTTSRCPGHGLLRTAGTFTHSVTMTMTIINTIMFDKLVQWFYVSMQTIQISRIPHKIPNASFLFHIYFNCSMMIVDYMWYKCHAKIHLNMVYVLKFMYNYAYEYSFYPIQLLKIKQKYFIIICFNL